MKLLQKIKITVKGGKEDSREKEGKPRPIADSVADELLQESKETLISLKESKGVQIARIWEEETPKKKASKEEKA